MSRFNARPANSRSPTWRQPKYRHLPYGRWITEDGTEVLFDRDYCPLFSRAPGAAAPMAMTGIEWIEDIAREEFLYKDNNPPWECPVTRQRCEQALKDFGVPST